MGQQGKKGEEKAGKYQGKDKRRKNIIYKYAERKGDWTREEGNRKAKLRNHIISGHLYLLRFEGFAYNFR